MKTFTFALVCCCGSPAFSQLEATTPVAKSLPMGIEYQGVPADAIVLNDKHGSSVILVTQTPIQPSKTWPDSKETELFVYRHITQSGSPQLLWKLNDFVKECPVDLAATFLGGTEAKGITVTDLDSDNDLEVWIAYRLVCRGDVSPATLKIIMYEGTTEHAMRGKSKVKVSDTGYAGGTYEVDSDLKNAPQVFKDYAKQLWEKVVTE